MKVKITKCSTGTWWYADKIGNEYVVEPTTFLSGLWKDCYQLVSNSSYYIHKDDCEIVRERVAVPTPDISVKDSVFALQCLVSECYGTDTQIVIESDCVHVNSFGKTFVCYKGEELEEITKAVSVLAGALSEP